ncbi:MAG TPA: hypothetical protein VGP72_10030 [Planctomycetota bacterium]|jgi:hypothetical protein
MSKLAGNTRAALLGVLFAMLGFTFALANYQGDDNGQANDKSAQARSLVGSVPLQFTNPLVVPLKAGESALDAKLTRDLGDAVLGSQFTRFVTATGGVVPYVFTGAATSNLPAFGNTVPGLSATGLTNFPTYGSLTGTVADTFAANFIAFGIKVTDACGSNVTSPFRLSIIADRNTVRFGTNVCSDAIQNQEYAFQIPILNGKGAEVFTAVTALPTGLVLGTDGKISGKAVVSGAQTFKISATKGGVAVLGRIGTSEATSTTTTMSINVQASVGTASKFVTTAVTVKAGNPLSKGIGKDSVSFAAQVDLAGASVSTLDGVATLRINNTVFPSVTLAGGKGASPKGTTANVVKATLSSKGQLKISIGKAVIGAELNVDNYTIQLTLGANFKANEVIKTTNKPGKGNAFQRTYKLGVGSLSGAFLITSVQGKDDKANTGDAWKVAFIAVPASGSFAGTANATVAIQGDTSKAGFSDTLAATESKGSVKGGLKGKPTGAKLTKIQMSTKGKGALQTSLVPAATSNIKTAPAGTADFCLTVELDDASSKAVYVGQGGTAINGSKTSWTNAKK